MSLSKVFVACCFAACGGLWAAGETEAAVSHPATRPRLVLPEFFDGDFSAVAFSPDGRQVLTAGPSRIAILWDWATENPVQVFRGHTGTISSAAFSPDGRRVVAGLRWDRKAILWDVLSGKKTRVLRAKRKPVPPCITSVAFSPDGREVIACGDFMDVVVWDAETGKRLRAFDPGDVNCSFVALSPDGRSVLAGGLFDGEFADDLRVIVAIIWDLQSGKRRTVIRSSILEAWHGAFSPDDKKVVIYGADASFTVWDAATGKLVKTFYNTVESADSMALSPKGHWLVTGHGCHRVILWDWSAGKKLKVFDAHCPESRHFSTYPYPSNVQTAVAISPDGSRIVSGSSDSTAIVWDARDGRILSKLQPHVDRIGRVLPHPDDTHIFTAGKDFWGHEWAVNLRDLRTGRSVRRLAQPEPIEAIAISTDGTQLLTGFHTGQAQLTELATGKTLTSDRHAIGSGLHYVAFVPGRQQGLIAGDREVAVWDLAKNEIDYIIKTRSPISVGALSPDGRLLLTVSDRWRVDLRDLHSGQGKASWETGGDAILAACFSPDGRSVAASRSSNTVTFWEIETGKVVRTFEGHEDKVASGAFSRCGKYLLTGGKQGLASLWDISTGKVVQTYGGSSHPAYWARFAAGGKRIVARSNDCSACIYDTQTGHTLARLYSLNKGRDWLTVTPQGYVDGSPGALKLLQWQVGNERVPFERYAKTYHRPDLVARALEGLAVEEPAPAAGGQEAAPGDSRDDGALQ